MKVFIRRLFWSEYFWVPVGFATVFIAGVLYLTNRSERARLAIDMARTLQDQLAAVKDQNQRSLQDRRVLHEENERSKRDRANLKDQQHRIMRSLERIEAEHRGESPK